MLDQHVARVVTLWWDLCPIFLPHTSFHDFLHRLVTTATPLGVVAQAHLKVKKEDVDRINLNSKQGSDKTILQEGFGALEKIHRFLFGPIQQRTNDLRMIAQADTELNLPGEHLPRYQVEQLPRTYKLIVEWALNLLSAITHITRKEELNPLDPISQTKINVQMVQELSHTTLFNELLSNYRHHFEL